LLFKYVRLASEHGKALATSAPGASDALNLELIQVFKSLKALGERRRLVALMTHPDPSVQCWSAIHSLRVEREQALRTLTRISEGKGPVAFNALVYARDWTKGKIPIAGDDDEEPRADP
jgi:hypothetical protein